MDITKQHEVQQEAKQLQSRISTFIGDHHYRPCKHWLFALFPTEKLESSINRPMLEQWSNYIG